MFIQILKIIFKLRVSFGNVIPVKAERLLFF